MDATCLSRIIDWSMTRPAPPKFILETGIRFKRRSASDT
jgi:hypothetical protein